MKRFLKRLSLFWIGLMGLPFGAQAYIPPSQFILKNLVKSRVALKTLKARSIVIGVAATGGGGAPKFIEETLYDSETGTLKSFALDETGREIYSIERNVSKLKTASEVSAIASEVLFESRAGHLFSSLKQWNIPVLSESELLKLETEEARRAAEKTFLARKSPTNALQVSWVIGELNSNQFWVEKDTFLPSRLVLKSENDLDLQFESYRTVKEVPFSYAVTVKSGGQALLRQEVQEVQVNTLLAADLKRAVVNGFTDLGGSAEPELRELVKRFYTLVR